MRHAVLLRPGVLLPDGTFPLVDSRRLTVSPVALPVLPPQHRDDELILILEWPPFVTRDTTATPDKKVYCLQRQIKVTSRGNSDGSFQWPSMVDDAAPRMVERDITDDHTN
jgi:hypothetical protein